MMMIYKNSQSSTDTSIAKSNLVHANLVHAYDMGQTSSMISKKSLLLASSILLLFLAQQKPLLAEASPKEALLVVALASNVDFIDRSSAEEKEKVQKTLTRVNDNLSTIRKRIDNLIADPQVYEDTPEPVQFKAEPVLATPVKPAAVKPVAAKPAPVKPAMVKLSSPTNNTIQPAKMSLPLASTPAAPGKQTITQSTSFSAAEINTKIYTKHGTDGSLLDDSTKQWSCVHDTNNDLMWEVKSSDKSMRDANNLYSWLDIKNDQHNGVSDGGRCKGDADCDTNAYVQVMNAQNYCGHNDWQLPTREQMQTLVDLSGDKKKAKINKDYFPQAKPSWYWTASENKKNENLAWYVLFKNGVALNDYKERPKHIRLVRKASKQAS